MPAVKNLTNISLRISLCLCITCVYPLRPSLSRHNDNKTFLVWVNEEDHLRVISMQKGGNMREVFKRFCIGLQKVHNDSSSKQTLTVLSGINVDLTLLLIYPPD